MLRTIFAASLAASLPAVAFAQTAGRSAPVIVTASPLAGGAENFATIVETLDRDQILKAGGANLADALSNVPGVAGAGFAAGASRPVIRGMDAQRVKLLEDGVGSFDVSEVGPDHGVPIDPLSAQRIEVVRGPGVLRYGGQAIGGVINAINNRVPLTLPEESLTGEAAASYASAAETGQGSVLLDARLGQFAAHVDAFARRASDYDTPGGEQPNSFFRGDGFSGGGSYFFGPQDKSRAGAALLHYDAQYGIPSDDTFIVMRQTKALSKSSFAIGAGPLETVTFDLGYATYLHDERDPVTGENLSTFKNREWDGRTEALFGALGPLSSAALGVQVQNRRYSALGEGGDFLFPTQTQSEALFAFAEAPLAQRLRLQFGSRVERLDIKGTPGSGAPVDLAFTPVSGAIGALWDATDTLKLGFTITSAARAPGQVELFARGPHDGPGTFETGDPALSLERSNSVEATLRVRAERLQIDAALWGARFDNYIYGRLTGRTCDDAGLCVSDASQDLKELFYAQDDADFWGAETKASYDLIRHGESALTIDALADLVRAQLAGGGEIPRVQPWRAGGGLSWTSPSYDVGFMLVHVGARDDVAAFETPTKGYADLQAQAAWRPKGRDKGPELAIVGRNLTDDVQRNATALNKDEVVQPGRDIRLLVRASF
ncbi:MAG: TonB-dependent receptor [Hyphomonadaceae bacterium]